MTGEKRGACAIDTPSCDGCQVLLRFGLVRSRRGPLSETPPRFAQSIALAVGFQDVDAMREAVEQGSRQARTMAALAPMDTPVAATRDTSTLGRRANAPRMAGTSFTVRAMEV